MKRGFSGEQTPLFPSMLAIQAEEGEGLGHPSEPQPPPSTAQPIHEDPIPNIVSTSHQKTQTPRQALNQVTEPHDSPLLRVNILGSDKGTKVLADAAKNVNLYTRRRKAVSTGSGRVSTASRLFSTAEELVSTAGASMTVSTTGMVQEVNIKDKERALELAAGSSQATITDSAEVESSKGATEVELDHKGSKKQKTNEDSEVGNHTEAYQNFADMLKKFDRDDLVKLWDLVKERFSTTEPIDDKEKELLVELKRLFEPNNQDSKVFGSILNTEGLIQKLDDLKGSTREIDGMLRIRLREVGSDEEIFTLVAWIRDFNINEPVYVELCHEFYSTYEFDELCADDELQSKKIIKFRLGGRAHNLTLLNLARRLGLYQAVELEEEGFNVYFEGGLRNDNNFNAQDYCMFDARYQNGYANVAWVIAKWMKRKGTGTKKKSQICCGQFILKLAWKCRVLTKDVDPQLSVPKVGIPRPSRASMHDLYDMMGRIEIRQDTIERMEYRQSYH
ncbi:hypothetical protein Tco_1394600 [Tanacetum coccineum]